MTTALIVGFGSIGARHARILAGLGLRTVVVSRRPIEFPIRYALLETALQNEVPDYVVIASSTDEHHLVLDKLLSLNFSGKILVEKPLFDHVRHIEVADYSRVFVAYNLRFHAVLQRLRQILAGEQILAAQVYAGQYLPDWRPGTDYRTSYSADRVRGGGVLRDLSHEIDYVLWLFGGWTRVAALGGQLSALEINSDDSFALLLETPACPIVTVQINYLDRPGRRSIVVNTAKLTVEADLVRGTISCNGNMETIASERDESYISMHRAALAANAHCDQGMLCTFAEGNETMRLIDAAEVAVQTSQWVAR
ncbi:putative dehydrogenase [Herbaspirillum sp. Sphag1AN]|uniref:Gfo/Idh/MocA family protein n=1 Tax=unclassified Herbaspirillum TaxID=2624150 RepID=UPI0016227C11|nr:MULTISPECIES: Gfo/Idh/MocA family oxidoreductase [unclassified Herbaspirillum]MBB3213007.1 putative dehydrogenase [Herbaspirillum sp. Sphag1AN]MBB3246204.1 putative dehydrogenase [Herbaspirillum sp. Sphag64]